MGRYRCVSVGRAALNQDRRINKNFISVEVLVIRERDHHLARAWCKRGRFPGREVALSAAA